MFILCRLLNKQAAGIDDKIGEHQIWMAKISLKYLLETRLMCIVVVRELPVEGVKCSLFRDRKLDEVWTPIMY